MCGLLVWIDDAAAHCKGGVLSFAVRCNAAASSVPFFVRVSDVFRMCLVAVQMFSVYLGLFVCALNVARGRTAVCPLLAFCGER